MAPMALPSAPCHKNTRTRTVLTLLAAALALHTGAIALRWLRLDHGPYVNLFEILSSNVWSLHLIVLLASLSVRGLRGGLVMALPVLSVLVLWMMATPARDTAVPMTYQTIWLPVHMVLGKAFLGLVVLAVGLAAGLVFERLELRGVTVSPPAEPPARSALAPVPAPASSPAPQGEPGRFRAAFEAGIAHLRQGDAHAAVQAFEAARRANPHAPEVYVNLGFAYLELGQPDASRTAFEVASTIAPGQVNAYFGLAEALEGRRLEDLLPDSRAGRLLGLLVRFRRPGPGLDRHLGRRQSLRPGDRRVDHLSRGAGEHLGLRPRHRRPGPGLVRHQQRRRRL